MAKVVNIEDIRESKEITVNMQSWLCHEVLPAINKYGGYIGQYTGNYKYKPNKEEVKTVRTSASTGVTDINNMLFLGFNGLKIAKVLFKYGVYIQLGREEEFINNIYKKSDEEARKEAIKAWQEVNLIIHKKFDIN